MDDSGASHLDGLDPFDLLDAEAARLDAHFAAVDNSVWTRPSRCEGWSVRDVLAHLSSGEDYHRACLDGTVAQLLAAWGERGASDLATANQMAIDDRGDLTTDALLAEWRAASADNLARFRERADATIDTSVGDYPNRLQAFHVASELATHADDVGVPVTPDEADVRLAWRTRFSAFALLESKGHLGVSIDGGTVRVTDGDRSIDLTAGDFVEAVAGRLGDDSVLSPADRELLSTTP